MVLEITNPERDLLFALIESAHREMIQEIDHTDTRDFRKLLKNKLDLLERVVAKDVGEAGRDDGFETEIHQCPRRVLSRAAAAEIISTDESLRTAINQGTEVRTVGKQMLPQTDFIGDFQEASRDDLIRIDVVLGYDDNTR